MGTEEYVRLTWRYQVIKKKAPFILFRFAHSSEFSSQNPDNEPIFRKQMEHGDEGRFCEAMITITKKRIMLSTSEGILWEASEDTPDQVLITGLETYMAVGMKSGLLATPNTCRPTVDEVISVFRKLKNFRASK